MTKSRSNDIVDYVTAAGIRYLPADQIYYKEYPFKVELSPLYKGLGTHRKVRFEIDIACPVRGREKLAEYIEKMDKIFLNVEHRNEIICFLEGLENCQHHRRMGGENSLVYLKNVDAIVQLIERFPDVVSSVTGPINDEHRAVFDEQRHVVMRDKLFYDQYRYQIKFKGTQEFVDNCQGYLSDVLSSKDPDTWRAHRLHTKFENRWRLLGQHPAMRRPPIFPPRSVILYLQKDEDFIHIKLLTAEYIESFQEIMLFDELN